VKSRLNLSLKRILRECCTIHRKKGEIKMTHTDISAEWQKICDEHVEASDANLKAFAAVTNKFAAIGQGAIKYQSNQRPPVGI
jgi:hypothetical protein